MKCRDAVDYKRRLDSLFQEVEKVEEFRDSPELMAHWARYLCILVSGFVEVALRSIYRDFATRKSERRVGDFVSSKLRGLTNLNMDKILQLTGSFSPEWRNQLESALDDQCRDAINSITALRNEIAHGKSTSISYVRIRDYYKRALETVEMIERQCESVK